MMRIDEQKLRHLVFIAQQRRMRSLAMPIETMEMIEANDPHLDEMDEAYHKASLAYLGATTDLLNYLEDCLDMRSEFRKI